MLSWGFKARCRLLRLRDFIRAGLLRDGAFAPYTLKSRVKSSCQAAAKIACHNVRCLVQPTSRNNGETSHADSNSESLRGAPAYLCLASGHHKDVLRLDIAWAHVMTPKSHTLTSREPTPLADKLPPEKPALSSAAWNILNPNPPLQASQQLTTPQTLLSLPGGGEGSAWSG